MDDHSENTRRIAKNTLWLYVRMLVSMLISLYTSRVILNMLGVEDYGIYNVVGGFVSMFSLLSASLTSASTRFITFELGKERGKPSAVFSNALMIHIVLAAVVLLAFETFGVWFLNNRMVIPEDRIGAANFVFQASVLSFVIRLAGVPYNSLVIAHERMDAFAFLGILEVLVKLAFVLFVAYAPFISDRLIVFSALMIALGICIQLAYVLYSLKCFPESHCGPRMEKARFKEMFSFAGWKFIGCAAGVCNTQGINVLMNIFFGTVANAAYGVATTVSNAAGSFASNFMTALNPQITKSYASDDREYLFSLLERGSRFSFYLIMFFALPLMFETPFVLRLWLGEYPARAVWFVRLMLTTSLIDIISNTLITAQDATGKIRNYQLVVGTMSLLPFPLAYIIFRMGCIPEMAFVASAVVSLCCLWMRLLFLRSMIKLPLRHFFVSVLLRIAAVLAISAVLPTILHLVLPYGWLRAVTVVFVSMAVALPVILYIGCSANERSTIIHTAKSKLGLERRSS